MSFWHRRILFLLFSGYLLSALACYQKAEFFLFNMVKKGDFKYKKSLSSAIAGQQEAREKLEQTLSEAEWAFD
jgi:hypothetical protein